MKMTWMTGGIWMCLFSCCGVPHVLNEKQQSKQANTRPFDEDRGLELRPWVVLFVRDLRTIPIRPLRLAGDGSWMNYALKY